MGWVRGITRGHIRYDGAVASDQSHPSRAGAALATLASGWREFWQGYWRSPRGC